MIVNESLYENVDRYRPILESSQKYGGGGGTGPSSVHSSNNDFQTLVDPSSLPSLPPALDPHLSTVRLFWYLFWLCIAEVAYLVGLLINYTFVTSEVVKHQDGEDEHPKLKLTPVILALYLAPSCLILLVSTITFFSKRYNYLVRKVLLFAVVLAFIGGIAGIIHALYTYIVTFHKYECEEYEGWTAGVARTLYVVLIACPLAFRFGFILAIRHDISMYDNGRSNDQESAFDSGPAVANWMKVLKFLDLLIMFCCMPVCCRDIKDNHTRHLMQHVVQLIYEIILLVVATVEKKYIELIAIVAGLLGSVMGISKVYMLDSVLNVFALTTGIFLLGNNAAKFNCTGEDAKTWIYLILFSLIASTIRFKSILHTFLEARVQIYNWLIAQIPWISTIGSTTESLNFAAHGFVRFYHIRNFFALRTFSDDSNHQHPHESSSSSRSESIPLVTKKPSKMKMSYLPIMVLLLIFIGFCLMIAFGGIMGAIYPQYKGGTHVKQIETWTESECTLLYYDAVYKDVTHTLYYYYVNTTLGVDLIAIPIQTRYADPLNLDVFNEEYQINLWQHATITCHIPDNPLLANSTSDVTFDYNRKNAVWNQVAILGNSTTLGHFESQYHLWLSLPPVMIGFGAVLFIAGILTLRHLLRSSNKNVKLKRAIK